MENPSRENMKLFKTCRIRNIVSLFSYLDLIASTKKMNITEAMKFALKEVLAGTYVVTSVGRYWENFLPLSLYSNPGFGSVLIECGWESIPGLPGLSAMVISNITTLLSDIIDRLSALF